VLSIPRVRRLWFAQILSGVGDWVAKLALGVLIFQRSGSALAAASVYAVAFLPYAVAPLVIAAVRRLPVRAVLVVCDIARALVFLLMATGLPTSLLLVLMFLGAFPSPVFEAVRTRVLPELLPASRTADGLVLQQLTTQLVATVGLLAGGVLVVLVHPTGALLINAGTFIASALLVIALPRTTAVGIAGRGVSGIKTHLALTFRALRKTPALRTAVLISITVTPGTMACEAVVVAYAHATHHSAAVGLLAAAPALAIAMGGLLLSREGSDAAVLTRAAQISVVGAVAGVVLLGLPLGMGGAVAGYLAVGVPCAATPMLLAVAVRNTSREYLASVVATVQAILMVASIVGALLGGVLAATMGVRTGCAVAMATVLGYPLVVLLRPIFGRSRLPMPAPAVRPTP
jgi:hypothetical protein